MKKNKKPSPPNDGNDKNPFIPQDFKLPDSILKQLNEFSDGGFILCRIGPMGVPEVYSQYDDMIKALGLIKYLAAWAASVDNINDQTIFNIIQQKAEEEGFEEEEE